MTEQGAVATVEAVVLGDLTYEAAEGELVELIGKLEAGDVPLEDSLQMWERATLLRAVCQELLTKARSRLSADAADGARAGTVADGSVAAPPEPPDDPFLTSATARETGSGLLDEPPF